MMVSLLQVKISDCVARGSFGIRQSGVLDFKVADVFQDAKLLQNASEEADRLLLDDPELEFPEHCKLKEHLRIKPDEIMLETTL